MEAHDIPGIKNNHGILAMDKVIELQVLLMSLGMKKPARESA